MEVAPRKQVAIEAAKMYYISGMSQDEIAEELGMSRSNVSRILKRSVEDGIVEITIHDNISVRPELSLKLQQLFELKSVIIVGSASTEEETTRNIGERLAAYLEQNLQDGTTLGVARGKASCYTGERLKNQRNVHVDVVQLQGAVSPQVSETEAGGLVSLFAGKLNGTGYVLNAPLMVRSKRTRQDLLGSDLAKATVQRYDSLDMAIFEIERPALYAGGKARQDWLTRAEVLQLSEDGVACGICGFYFGGNGRRCNTGINDRVIGITPEQMRRVPNKVGIIMGRSRLSAVVGAIKSGLVNILVMDENLAFRLYESAAGKNPEERG